MDDDEVVDDEDEQHVGVGVDEFEVGADRLELFCCCCWVRVLRRPTATELS